MNNARMRMIGSGIPINQSNAPRPKPMSASIYLWTGWTNSPRSREFLGSRGPSIDSRLAIPIQREITQERRGGPCDQIADQLRGEKTECYSVAAITIGGVDVFCTRDQTDQRQPVAGGAIGHPDPARNHSGAAR